MDIGEAFQCGEVGGGLFAATIFKVPATDFEQDACDQRVLGIFETETIEKPTGGGARVDRIFTS